MSDTRPNILLLCTDQQRFDTIAALGNPLIRTPTLDRLCRDGTAFTRGYCCSPVCAPARAALATGLSPHQNGCIDNCTPVIDGVPSFIEHLADAGYQTHGVGKMHFTPDGKRMWGFESRDFSEEFDIPGDDFQQSIRDAGFGHISEPLGVRSDMYYIPQTSGLPERLHHTSWTADRSIDFLERRDRERPFFLWSSFIRPHPPFDNPEPWHKLYAAAEMPDPARFDGEDDLLCFWNHVQNRYKYRDGGWDRRLVQSMTSAYYGAISFIDAQIARILDALGDDADHTLILFTSDHGELLGDYGAFGKRSMHEASVRVPLIAVWPDRMPQGKRCSDVASHLDIFPTVLSAAGCEVAEEHEGVDLTDLAHGRHDRSHVFAQFQSEGLGLFMAAGQRFKYVFSQPDDREWLFDLEASPIEREDLAADPKCAATLDELRETMIGRFEADGYESPIAGGRWRRYPRQRVPLDPDAGLLYQNASDLTERLSGIEPYFRREAARRLKAKSYKPTRPGEAEAAITSAAAS